MKNFPKNVFGICPCGHNAVAGTSGGANSTNQISGTEEVPLFWSTYWGRYVCKLCLAEAKDRIHDDANHKRHNEDEQFLSKVGFEETI